MSLASTLALAAPVEDSFKYPNQTVNQINGSPTTKDNNITQIINKFKLNRNDCVLIGDSINDFNAANINNIEFIGYNNIDLKNRIKNYAIKLDNFL